MSVTYFNQYFKGTVVLANEFKLTSVDGSNVEYVGYIELEIEVDGWKCPAGFLVIKGNSDPAVILGSNVFRQWVERGSSEWRRERWCNLAALHEQEEGDIFVAGKHKVLIPANSMRIMGYTMKEGSGTVYIQNKDESCNIVVSNALVADQEGRIPVELVNFRKEYFIFKAEVKWEGGTRECNA